MVLSYILGAVASLSLTVFDVRKPEMFVAKIIAVSKEHMCVMLTPPF